MSFIPLFAQNGVGINTTNLDDGSALQIESTIGTMALPRMTNTQMQEIDGPLEGSIVFNTTDSSLYIRINEKWIKYVQLNNTPSIILNKNGGSLVLQENPPLPIPLNGTNILHNVADYYEVSAGEEETKGDSTIKILQDGLYLVTAGMSTTNLPAGPRKYKLLVYVNGTLKSYLTSGNVNLSKSDFWGTSGNSVLLLETNDVVEIKYTLDGNRTITAKFFNIGISKL
tara:strand:+ start:26836 stop:27516 length:681 start_codon:yes stop_codon:yes gene_type:complete